MAQHHFLPFLRDFLTAEDKEGVFNADHFPLWYKRAAEQVPGTFVYSIPFSTGTVRVRNTYMAGRTTNISTSKAQSLLAYYLWKIKGESPSGIHNMAPFSI